MPSRDRIGYLPLDLNGSETRIGLGSMDHLAQSRLFHLQQEKEKIVLYIPTGEDLDRKIKNIGLCEALVKFTQ